MSGVIVGGVDLSVRFGLRLTDDSEFRAPSVKMNMLDLPGGDGSLDATEVFGDVLYENREDSMVFAAECDPGAQAFERLKTDISRFLHGRSFDYVLPHDPGYIYHGRFAVDEAYARMHYRRVKLKVTSRPYKSAGVKVHEVDAQAGAHLSLLPGRGRVRPVFESSMPIHVISNGIDVTLPSGSHTAVGLTIRDGASDVYVNTGGSVRGGSTAWADLAAESWGNLKTHRWHQAMWTEAPPAANEAYIVRIAYEVLEL